jgi:hypothetical protein
MSRHLILPFSGLFSTRKRSRNRRPGKACNQRAVRFTLESLEQRQLLAWGVPSSLPYGYTPALIRHAYGFDQITFSNGVKGDGSGETIAIVGAYDDPKLVDTTSPTFSSSDLAMFDAAMGLANPPSFIKYGETGSISSLPAPDMTGAYASTAIDDVEWAHAIAPNANIALVEASSGSNADLLATVRTASSLPGVSVVAMSLNLKDPVSGNFQEFSGETADDPYFTTPAGHAGVSFVAASGNNIVSMYPAASPNVLAVGGTTLQMTSGGTWTSETGWNVGSDGALGTKYYSLSSGGGFSPYETIPSYQVGVHNTNLRTTPDVSYDADPVTGFAVYDSYDDGAKTPWIENGGTGFGAAQWAALVAIVDQGLAIANVQPLSSAMLLPAIYGLPASDFHDITANTASDGGNSAFPGYDYLTGRGSPIANNIVADLVNSGTLAVSPAAVSPVAGQPFTGTVATFTVADPANSTNSFTAAINWGDGQSSGGTITYNSATKTYAVAGTHTYTAGGGFTITITVQNGSMGSAVGTDPIAVKFPIPTLTSTSPNQVAQGYSGALTLAVTGTGFYAQSVVDWNGAALPTTYVSATQITATVPASDFASAGYQNVTVLNPAPGGGRSNSLPFAVDYPTPTLTSIAPNQIAEGYSGPLTLTVTGAHFYPQSVIDWNGSALATTYVSAGTLTATIPASDFITPGNEQITVTNPAPCTAGSNSATFAVNYPTPTLTSIGPNQVTVGYSGPLTLTVIGAQFYPQSVIKWNGTALPTTYVSAGALTATIPASDFVSLGSFPITVTNPAPGGGSSSSQTFRVIPNPTPVLTSISSNEVGADDPAAWYLAVAGTNFVPGSVIYWNSTPLATNYKSSTALSTYIPASDLSAAGTFAISVFSPSPGGGFSSSAAFHVITGTQSYYDSASGSYYLLQTSGELDRYSAGAKTVVDANVVTSFAVVPTGSATFSKLYALEPNPPDSTNGPELIQWTSTGGRQAFDSNDVLSYALNPSGTVLYDLDGNYPGDTNGGELMQYTVGGGWSGIDNNDVLSFALNPSGTVLYYIDGNTPGWPNGGRLVQNTVGVGPITLDSNDVLSFALNPSGTVLYDLEGNYPASTNGGRLVQYTVGGGWSLIDNNDVLSFAMNPSGTVLYYIDGNTPGWPNGGRLMQYAVGGGYTTLDSNDVLSFAMNPSGTVIYDLQGNWTGNYEGPELVQYTVGGGFSLIDSNDVLSFAMAPNGATLYALEGYYSGDTSGGRLVQYSAQGGITAIDTNNVSSFAMTPSGQTLYALDSATAHLEQYHAGNPTPVLFDGNSVVSFAMAPNGATVYDLRANGNLVQFTTGAAPIVLDNNGTGSFAMAPNGVTLYDLEFNGYLYEYVAWSGFSSLDKTGTRSFAMAPSGETYYELNYNGNLWEYTVGDQPLLLDSNIVVSFAMAPSGMTLYDIEGYYGNRLVQYSAWVGWTLLDGASIQSFAMSPSGTTVFALESYGSRLVKYQVGIGWSLVTAPIQSWAVAPGLYGPDTIYVAGANGIVYEYAM